MIRTRTARVAIALAATCAAGAAIIPAVASANTFTADVSNFTGYHLTPESKSVSDGKYEPDQLPTIAPHSQHRSAFFARGTGWSGAVSGRVSYEAEMTGQWGPRGHVTIEFGVPFIGLDSADCYVDEGMKEAQIQCRVPRAPSGDDPRVEFVVEKVPPKQ